jgi:hypothetical protein
MGRNPSDESLGYSLSPWRAGALAFVLFMGLSCSLFAQTNDGSGPEISVPRNLPPDLAHALPPPNWIDQSQLLQKEF